MNDELHNFLIKNCTPENAFPGLDSNVLDWPLWFRKEIYDNLKRLNLDSIDEDLKKLKTDAVGIEVTSGMHVMVYRDKITVFIRVAFYNRDEKQFEEDRMFTINIPRDKLDDLIKEKDEKNTV